MLNRFSFNCALMGGVALALTITSNGFAETLLWSEEFDSGTSPDTKTWSYDLGTGQNGWGNQELQEYTSSRQNVKVEDGMLHITVQPKLDGSNVVGFTSARIKTQDKLMLQYGTVEARIKLPDLDKGLWPAFWTLGNDFSQVGWPSCGEIDILEMGGADAISSGNTNRRVYSTAHWDNNGSYASYGLSKTFGEDFNEEFHIFKLEWTPNFIRTYVDGTKLWEINIRESACSSCTEFHAPHFMILNMAVGGTFTDQRVVSSITAPTPASMMVDYIRVYDNGYTETSGPAAEPPDIGPAHSGSWYNPEQSGHGFSMEFGQLDDGTRLAIVYWYTYDEEGNPIFMLGTGTPDGNRVEVSFESPVGMVYGEFDPDSVQREDGGTAVIEFNNRENGSFTYTPSEFTQTRWGHLSGIDSLPLVKLFGIAADTEFADE